MKTTKVIRLTGFKMLLVCASIFITLVPGSIITDMVSRYRKEKTEQDSKPSILNKGTHKSPDIKAYN